MFIRSGKRAQTTAEYAILIALVIGAVVAMQIYVKRGIQGRIRDVVDDVDLGSTLDNSDGQAVASDVFGGGQYEPYYASSTATTAQSSSNTENLQTGGSVDRASTSNVSVSRTQDIGWAGYEEDTSEETAE